MRITLVDSIGTVAVLSTDRESTEGSAQNERREILVQKRRTADNTGTSATPPIFALLRGWPKWINTSTMIAVRLRKAVAVNYFRLLLFDSPMSSRIRPTIRTCRSTFTSETESLGLL